MDYQRVQDAIKAGHVTVLDASFEPVDPEGPGQEMRHATVVAEIVTPAGRRATFSFQARYRNDRVILPEYIYASWGTGEDEWVLWVEEEYLPEGERVFEWVAPLYCLAVQQLGLECFRHLAD